METPKQPSEEEMAEGEEMMNKSEKAGSSEREVYLKLAEQAGVSPDDLEEISLELDRNMHGITGFSGEIKGVEMNANKNEKGIYSVIVGNERINDQYLAQKLYEKYYPAARLLSAEHASSFDTEGVKLINELL